MNEDYHLLIESIKDYAIYMLDVSGHIATWNLGAERMKGYPSSEAIGKHFSMLFTSEDGDKMKPEKELEISLARGRYEEEGWRVRKDGSRFWANVIMTPVFEESGKHVGYSKITRDLTEKRRTEELFVLLVSQVKEYAIFMMDVSGQILTWNQGAERIKGYLPHEIIGKHFSTFYIPEEKAANKPANALTIAIRTGKYEEEGWRLRKDGSLFWASVIITPIYTDRHIGFAKVTRDLTERKEMEKLSRSNAILEATNKELERFASTASHDLKEPLRKIITYSGRILLEDKSLASSTKESLNKIISASKRMNVMIDDIMNLSTLSGKEHFESYSLKDILSESADLLEHSIAEKGAVIHGDHLPRAIIIPSQMRRLFQNLISNAIKFSKKDVRPEIHITFEMINKVNVSGGLWPADEYLRITFRDNGIGFDQQDAERIFNHFDRLHSKSAYEGSGLGLSICRKIAENHGGALTATSRIGEGAEFSLVIPG